MKKILYNITALLLLPVFIFKTPTWHYNYLRNRTGKTVVTVWAPEKAGGGTGFHIKTKKGNIYLLTNAHVCDVSKDGLFIDVETYDGHMIKRRIIENSDKTDLCLIEPVPNADYLTLGSEAKPGDIVASVGHPHLLPTTMSRGEVITNLLVKVPIGLILSDEDAKNCNKPKLEIAQVYTNFGPAYACVEKINAIASTVPILPGNSGSPLINIWGNVVGIVFASNEAHWGFSVQLSEIESFLEVY